MLWLCITFPRLPLEALHGDASQATIVVACEDGARTVICCSPAAEKARIKPGASYAAALAMHPDVLMLERKLSAERAALQRLAGWGYQFSATVILSEISPEPRCARSAALWIEIGASLKLFGGLRSFLERFERELKELRYTYQLGAAPTLEGAALLARSGVRIAVATTQTLHARIRGLPLSKLMLTPEDEQRLHAAGVRTVGLLLELPRTGLARRFGPQLCNLLARLTGEAPDPRPAYRLPQHYDARFEFEFEISNTEALLFPLRRMLREFAGFLRARDTCVQRFTLALSHRNCTATQLRIGLSAPDRSAERFLALIREQIERTTPPAPTIELRLSADQFAAPTALQSDLLHGELQQAEEFSHTLDRLVARLGEGQVHGLTTIADHRPEASWAPRSHDPKRSALRFPERPLWLLPKPQPLERSSIAQIIAGPERIEGGWWDGSDVQRDYYIVRTSAGAQLWAYRDLSAGRDWRVHGFWS